MDYLAEIGKKETVFQPLKERQDSDNELFILYPHEMKNFEGKTMPRMRHTTLPAAQSFAKRVLAVLHKATRQTVVEGDKLDDKQTFKIETFIDTAFEMADDLLAGKQMARLKPFLNSTSALRGWIGSRNLVYKNSQGETVFDVLPWDIRDATWESGPNGLLWAAYKRKVTKAQAAQEFGFAPAGKGNDVEVTDVWDENFNYVFVGKEQAKEEWRHGLGYVPVMIQPVSFVPMLMLRGTESPWKYYGESIFSGSRGLYPKINDLATLFMTMAAEGYHPAYQKETDDLNEDVEVPQAGDVALVSPGKLFREMPKRDLYQVQLHAWNVLNAELQRATLPYIEYGELAFELSAVAIAKLGEGRELIFAPIIIALATGYKQIARMLIDQFIKGGFKQEIGRPGRKVNFTPKQLQGDYDIRFDFHSISPEENIANYSVGQAAKALNILPDDVILTEILKRSNPAKDKQLMAEQRLQQEVPTLYLFNQAHRLVDEGRFVEVRLIADQIGMTFEEITRPQTKAGAKKIKGMPQGGAKLPQGEAELLEMRMERKGARPQEERVVAE